MKASGASVQPRVSPRQGGLKFLAVLSIFAGAGLVGAAEAAPASHGAAAKPSKEAVTSALAKDVETTSAIQASAGIAPYCDSSRKRLFVEGEGWIVRKVTTCY